MESIEVWMWMIAGMIMGGLVFMGGFGMISKYIYNSEKDITIKEFENLHSSVTRVCQSGTGTRELKTLTFPTSVSKIFVRDENNLETKGRELCYIFREEGEQCMKIKSCDLDMNSLFIVDKTGLFAFIGRSLGKKSAASFQLNAVKEEIGLVTLKWTEELSE